MAQSVATFLMFDGTAEKALAFYLSLFEDARLESIERYGAGEEGAEGSVKQATFFLNEQRLMCIDSPVKHDFSFTPAVSLFVDCNSEAKVDRLFELLSDGGQVFMPLDGYPFSRKFGWLADRFGVSWQLNLP